MYKLNGSHIHPIHDRRILLLLRETPIKLTGPILLSNKIYKAYVETNTQNKNGLTKLEKSFDFKI